MQLASISKPFATTSNVRRQVRKELRAVFTIYILPNLVDLILALRHLQHENILICIWSDYGSRSAGGLKGDAIGTLVDVGVDDHDVEVLVERQEGREIGAVFGVIHVRSAESGRIDAMHAVLRAWGEDGVHVPFVVASNKG